MSQNNFGMDNKLNDWIDDYQELMNASKYLNELNFACEDLNIEWGNIVEVNPALRICLYLYLLHIYSIYIYV